MHNDNQHMTLHTSIAGEFDVLLQKMAVDAAGNEYPVGAPRLVHSQKNLITNSGMDFYGQYPSTLREGWGMRCRVGSGSTAPTFNDTALVAQVAQVTRGTTEGTHYTMAWGTGADLNKLVFTKYFTFPTGAAAGNLAELGIDSGSGNLQTRALFTDAGGTPITVSPASDEQLIVIYRTIYSQDLADSTYNFTTSPSNIAYTLTLRALGVGVYMAGASTYIQPSSINAYNGATSGLAALGASNPVGTYLGQAGAFSNAAYVAGSFTRSGYGIFGATSANGANIGALEISCGIFRYQVGISPRLTKVNPETIKVTLTWTWSRA